MGLLAISTNTEEISYLATNRLESGETTLGKWVGTRAIYAMTTTAEFRPKVESDRNVACGTTASILRNPDATEYLKPRPYPDPLLEQYYWIL